MSVSIQLSAQAPLALSADVLVVAVSPGPLAKQEPLASLDKALSGGLAKLIAREEFKGEKDQQLDAPALGALPFARLVLLGTGTKGQVSNADLRTLAAKAAKIANGAKAKSLALAFADNLAIANRRPSSAPSPSVSVRRPKLRARTKRPSSSGKAWLPQSPSPAIWSTSPPTSSIQRASPKARRRWLKRRASSASCSTRKRSKSAA
jgi:hypothetical protein